MQIKPLDTYKENKYINFCISLAKNGITGVFMNPMVGACLIYEDRVIGFGYHKKYGGAHAEVEAIQSVKSQDRDLISKATLYVTLEPCNHYGKTGPCTEFILRHKITKLVFGCFDPNPLMQGKSIAFLQQNGVQTIGPIEDQKCRNLIQAFTKRNREKKPFVTLKWAQTKDFYIGKENEKVKISNPISDIYVHKLRSEHDGILIGSETALRDLPLLNNRHWSGTSPKPILLDRRNRLPHISELNSLLNKSIHFNKPEQNLEQVLDELFAVHQIGSVLVEGGQQILQSFIDQNLWDEAHIITNRSLSITSGIKAPFLLGQLFKTLQIKADSIQIVQNLEKI
jgi:diaminohydroxyphosphoribosylaminopyrimidine deaminase/5-amino-6-(5-phosphoribosylamino)uracil reductase